MIKHVVIQGYRIFRQFEMELSGGLNIIVGGNEAGKSTLLEAISLALTGRVNGRRADDQLNPYWFNQQLVTEYFAGYTSAGTGSAAPAPEIVIEVYLESEDPDVQLLRGVHNSRREDAPGVCLRIKPRDDYADELQTFFTAEDRIEAIPVEYYEVEWADFSGAPITRRPKALGLSLIDSRTIRATRGVDFNTREMLHQFVDPKERAAISVAHRRAQNDISKTVLANVSQRIAQDAIKLHDKPIGLQMDQSSASSWESDVVPDVAGIPFALAGQGQQAAIKVALAMNHTSNSATYVLIEEPENHLSHTSLTRLIDRIEDLAAGRQVFITTHSSYVLNRLGLDRLRLLHAGVLARLTDVSPGTVDYFKRLSGFDTLRLVVADKLVLVEGPSDEIIFERAFRDQYNKRPIDVGIDIFAVRGVGFARALELATAIDRQAAAIRDNDGQDPSHWTEPLASYLDRGKREMFVSDPADGPTLEPQLIKANNEGAIRSILGLTESQKELVDWMTREKVGAALRISDAQSSINYPKYILDAIDFITS